MKKNEFYKLRIFAAVLKCLNFRFDPFCLYFRLLRYQNQFGKVDVKDHKHQHLMSQKYKKPRPKVVEVVEEAVLVVQT